MDKMKYLIQLLSLFAIYYFFARVGLSFGAVNKFATLVWLPSGISLAILLLSNIRLWPAIIVASFLVNLTIGAPVLGAFIISIGNTLEAVIAVLILRKVGFTFSFRKVRDVYYFLLAIALGSTIASFLGASSLLITHTILLPNYVPTAGTWWFGDFISMLIFTPFIITWATAYKIIRRISLKKFIEAVALTLCVILLSIFIYWGGPGIFRNAPKTYLIFPFLIWTALRFGILGSTTINLLLFLFATSGSILGIGPLVDQNLTIRLALVQGFLTITTTTTFILAAVNNERRDLDSRKDDFISMASHELKTPVTSTKILIQVLLKQTIRNPKIRKLLLKTNKQLDQLTRLVNELLDVTKIEQGKLDLKKEIFSVKPVINDVISSLALTTTHRFINNFPTPVHVLGDKQRLHQVITNIVINAIKFSPPMSKIIITEKMKSDNLIISIQDFGIGIPQSEQMHVFDRFYQIKKNNRDTYPGVGLGLFIVKEIVTRMHGAIWVESIEGKGTTFYFSLPIYRKINSSKSLKGQGLLFL